MATVNKIASNITGLAYAEEESIGVLPGSPEWYRLNPNSYSDFGGEIITVAPNPINPSRQRRKGVTTDLNASGGFNHNLTFQNLTDLMQGVMFADIRRKGRQTPSAVTVSGDPDVYEIGATAGFLVGSLIAGTGFTNLVNNALNVVTAVTADTSVGVADGQLVVETPPSTARLDVVGYQFGTDEVEIDVSGDLPVLMVDTTPADLTTLNIVPGQWVYIGGDTAATQMVNAANGGWKRVRSVTATAITFDKSESAMVTEDQPTDTPTKTIQMFFGDVLRNETGSLIVRRTYHMERTLGAPDDSSPSDIQSEVLEGTLLNEFTLNVPSAELANVDFTTIAIDAVQRLGTDGPLQSSVGTFPTAKEYNTSSDVGRIRLSTITAGNEAPDPLFAFVMELTLSINNNVTPDKAVGVLGAFDVTAGTFSVSGEMTAYFADVAATQAIRTNADVTLDVSFVKDNTGIVFDLPLVSLGNGRLEVEVDQSIKLPLTTDAASGEDVDPNLDHTLLITYFNYLPDAA